MAASVNHAPVATDDKVSVYQRSSVGDFVVYRGVADSDADGDELLVTRISFEGNSKIVTTGITEIRGSYGNLNIYDSGLFQYYSDSAINVAVGNQVTDTFTYTISDGNGGFDSALLSIDVIGSDIGDYNDNYFLLTGIGKQASGYGGNDTYVVNQADDKVIEAAGDGTADRVFTSVSYTLAANQEIETLATTSSSGTGAINLTGNEFAQAILGNAGANRLDGKVGADTLSGLSGNDIYAVDNASDRVVEAAGGGSDRVNASISYTLAAGQEIETLSTTDGSGTAIIHLTGNDQNQTIFGNAAGNRLDGKGGADTLYGYGGNDIFLFTTTPNVGDHIRDFSAADDTMHLAKSVFAALPTGRLSSTAFKDLGVSGAKLDADDRVIYNHNTGALSYDADGIGAGKAVQFAILDNHASLTFQDFYIV